MRTFEYIRFYSCDICDKPYGNTDTTKLATHDEIPEICLPRTWQNIKSKDGHYSLHVCDEHTISIDGQSFQEWVDAKTERRKNA